MTKEKKFLPLDTYHALDILTTMDQMLTCAWWAATGRINDGQAMAALISEVQEKLEHVRELLGRKPQEDLPDQPEQETV